MSVLFTVLSPMADSLALLEIITAVRSEEKKLEEEVRSQESGGNSEVRSRKSEYRRENLATRGPVHLIRNAGFQPAERPMASLSQWNGDFGTFAHRSPLRKFQVSTAGESNPVSFRFPEYS